MRAVGAYVYAGGFSIGVTKVINVVAHLEDSKPYGRDVIDLNRDEYWHDMPVWPYPWPKIEGDLLYGNPPCAPFSNNNVKSFIAGSYANDPRISCWYNLVEYGIKYKFNFIAVETVPQVYSKGPEFLEEMMARVNDAGYHVVLFLHNAALMGSVQNRPRLLFLASPYEIYLGKYLQEPLVTVGDVLLPVRKYKNDRPMVGPTHNKRYLEAIKATQPGEALVRAWDRLYLQENHERTPRGIKGRPSICVKKLHKDKLSSVVCGFPTIHPTRQRYLTIKEYQILGDFPEDYIFPQTTAAMKLVARGVSSRVGLWLGNTAYDTLHRKERPSRPPRVLHHGLDGWSSRKEYNLDEYLGLPAVPLRSKFK